MEYHDTAGHFEPVLSSFPDVDPPEYPGLPERVFPITPSVFQLPTFEQVMGVYEYEDSLRLPTYQARQLGRYHPYQRFHRHPSPEIDRYIVRAIVPLRHVLIQANFLFSEHYL
jgi:hypothetical protein